jgi:hypothetical protein
VTETPISAPTLHQALTDPSRFAEYVTTQWPHEDFVNQPPSWTLAYRRPRANRFQRVTDWCGTWREAYAMAAVFGQANPGLQVYYVPTAAYERAHSRHEDDGNILTPSGRRVRMVETGTIHLGEITPQPEAQGSWCDRISRNEAQALRDMLAKGYQASREFCFTTTRLARGSNHAQLPPGINAAMAAHAAMRIEFTLLGRDLTSHLATF